jgi:hypothetical protein
MNLGLDELMIVNPGVHGIHALFLDGDGALYAVEAPRDAGRREEGARFFLGDDGTLYQALPGRRR